MGCDSCYHRCSYSPFYTINNDYIREMHDICVVNIFRQCRKRNPCRLSPMAFSKSYHCWSNYLYRSSTLRFVFVSFFSICLVESSPWLRTGFWPRRFPWLYGRVLLGFTQFMALFLYFTLWFCALVSLVHRSARWLPWSCSRSAVRQQAAVVHYEPIHKAVPLIPKTAYCAPH